MKKGRLYWITGLSGSGKTTIGKRLVEKLREMGKTALFIDGDKIREVYANTDYTEEGRDKVAWQNLRLCKMITDQGIDVVCAFIAMKEKYREWNRKNIEEYFEVYLDVPIEILIQRDSKGLYKRALKHEISNVYGIDMEYEKPEKPDVVIENYGKTQIEEICNLIITMNKEVI